MTAVSISQLHKIDVDNDPNWHAKLKANRELANQDSRVQAIQAWAIENYENGADVIVEAFEPDEILTDLADRATTPEEAINNARELCRLRRSVENDIRGYGDLPPLPSL